MLPMKWTGSFVFLFRQTQDIVGSLKHRSDMITLKLSRDNFEYCAGNELVVWKGQRMNYANLLGGLVIGKLVRSDWIVNIVGMNKQWGLLMNPLSVFFIMLCVFVFGCMYVSVSCVCLVSSEAEGCWILGPGAASRWL